MTQTTERDYCLLYRAALMWLQARAAWEDGHPDELGALHGIADTEEEIRRLTEYEHTRETSWRR